MRSDDELMIRRSRTVAAAFAARGETDKAVSLLEQVLAVAPADPEASYVLGGLLQRRRQHGRAAELFAAALRQDPENLVYLWAAADAALALGRKDEVLAFAESALDTSSAPQDVRRIGFLYADAGRDDRAAELFRRVLDADPSDADAALGLSRIVGSEDPLSAVAMLEAFANGLDAPNADVQAGIGCLRQVTGDHVAARAAFEKALQIDPNNRIATLELSRYVSDDGRYAEATAMVSRLLDRDPCDDRALRSAAKHLRRAGDLPATAVLVGRALTRGNTSPWGPLLLADTLDSLGLRRRAVAILDGFQEPDPPDDEVELKLAEVCAKCGLRDRAERTLDNVLARGVPPRLRPNQGVVLLELGRIEEALDVFAAVVERTPGDLTTLGRLATWLAAMGRREQANETLRSAVRMQPANLQLQQNLGMALLSQGAFEEGFDNYLSIYRRDPYRARFDLHRCPFLYDLPPGAARRVVAWSDQGFGDQLIGLSMIGGLLREHDLTLEVDPRFRSLVARSLPSVAVIGIDEVDAAPFMTEAFDAHIPISLIPRLFLRTFDDIRPYFPLLVPDPARVAAYRAELRSVLGDRPAVGVSWRSANFNIGRYKSTRLADWAPILRMRDMAFVNLQYGDCEGDIAEAERVLGVRVYRGPAFDRHADLEGVVALVEALDAVVSTSNTNAHFAGVLRRPAVTLLSNDPGRLWYWFEGRFDSPWYPAMRLVRQKVTGAWEAVFEEAAAVLGELLGRG